MDKRLAMIGLIILVCLIMGGCPAHMTTGWDKESSKAKYKECLEAFPGDVSKCEGLKKLYEIDKGAAKALNR